MKKILSSIMMLATMMAAMTTLTSCEEEDDYIAQQLRSSDWVPRSTRQNMRKVETAMHELQQRLGRPPSESEVA